MPPMVLCGTGRPDTNTKRMNVGVSTPAAVGGWVAMQIQQRFLVGYLMCAVLCCAVLCCVQAAAVGATGIVQLLLDAGGDVGAVDVEGLTGARCCGVLCCGRALLGVCVCVVGGGPCRGTCGMRFESEEALLTTAGLSAAAVLCVRAPACTCVLQPCTTRAAAGMWRRPGC